jgi:hypothetical protein
MATTVGTNLLNFWQWAWQWQRTPVFPNAPFGFGVSGSIDDIPGFMERIIAAGVRGCFARIARTTHTMRTSVRVDASTVGDSRVSRPTRTRRPAVPVRQQ